MRAVTSFLKIVLAFLFVAGGTYHFINPEFYVGIVPPAFPSPLFLVYLSGALEVIFGILLLVPRFSRFAAWCIIALLIAVFPANIYMATNPQNFPEFNQTSLLIRLPLQLLLIGWAFIYAKKHRKPF